MRDLGAARVMLGSDLPTNAHVELDKVRGLGLSAEAEGQVLGETVVRVFKLKAR